MAQKTMYSGMDGSPFTTTTASISNTDLTISVAELGNLPSAPNLCVVFVSNSKWERCLYTAKSNTSGVGTLTVTRSGEGHASSDGGGAVEFDSGAKVSRNCTSFDNDRVKENIEDLEARKIAADGLIPFTGPFAVTHASANTYRNLAVLYTNSTGTLKIQLPLSWTSSLLQFVIRGCTNFSSTAAWQVMIGGTNHATLYWNYPTATIIGDVPFTSVRLAHDGTNCCILLGTTTTAWNYSNVVLETVIVSGAGRDSGWGSGYVASVITDESTLTNIVTATFRQYQPLDSDLTSIAELSGTSGVLKKTEANTWALDTHIFAIPVSETAPVSPVEGELWLQDGDNYYNSEINVIHEITVNSGTMAQDNAYIPNNASLVTLNLPVSCAVGGKVTIFGKGAGKWKIAQSSGQIVHFNNESTTPGVSGYIMANNRYDSVELRCITANTEFVVVSVSGDLGVL